MTKVKIGEYAPFYQTYIDKIHVDPVVLLETQKSQLTDYISENSNRLDYKYGEGKWDIREVIIHICDTESIFIYRLLRIARGDTTALPGFDQDVFNDGSDFSHIEVDDLINHFICIRNISLSLINTLTEEQLDRVGVASGQKVSAGSIVYMIAGHTQHHIDILLERYGA